MQARELLPLATLVIMTTVTLPVVWPIIQWQFYGFQGPRPEVGRPISIDWSTVKWPEFDFQTWWMWMVIILLLSILIEVSRKKEKLK